MFLGGGVASNPPAAFLVFDTQCLDVHRATEAKHLS